MKKLDSGVGAAGLIALATILACFLAVALPVIRSEPPAHTSDWLGFAGGAVGGIMTLVAAGVAWFAVQRQISVQTTISASQNAIQTYNILSEEDRFLNHDSYLAGQVDLYGRYFAAQVNWLKKDDPHIKWIEAAKEAFSEQNASFINAINDFEAATDNSSAFPDGARTRQELVAAASALKRDVIWIVAELRMAEIKIGMSDQDWKTEWQSARSKNILGDIQECSGKAKAYRDKLLDQRLRVIKSKRSIREREGF
ncbi:MAG: hypothetical protein WBF99_12390 [Xanthobacteraceae bacterium]